ncbi:MAG: hypothetical protein ACK5KL_01220 [Dysgonomonas sp.]
MKITTIRERIKIKKRIFDKKKTLKQLTFQIECTGEIFEIIGKSKNIMYLNMYWSPHFNVMTYDSINNVCVIAITNEYECDYVYGDCDGEIIYRLEEKTPNRLKIL